MVRVKAPTSVQALHPSLPNPLQDDDGNLATHLRLVVGEEGHLGHDLRPEVVVLLAFGDDGPRLIGLLL